MSAELTLYFDGRFPACIGYALFLHRADRHRRLAFVDITAERFDPAPLHTDLAALNRTLHARRANGDMLTGVPAICAAFALAGKGWMTLPLRLPVLRALAVPSYLVVARHRHRLSRLLGLRAPPGCTDGLCRSTPW